MNKRKIILALICSCLLTVLSAVLKLGAAAGFLVCSWSLYEIYNAEKPLKPFERNGIKMHYLRKGDINAYIRFCKIRALVFGIFGFLALIFGI